MVEVLVQVIYIFQDGKLAGNTDVVDGVEALGVSWYLRPTPPAWGMIGMSNLGDRCISRRFDFEALHALPTTYD